MSHRNSKPAGPGDRSDTPPSPQGRGLWTGPGLKLALIAPRVASGDGVVLGVIPDGRREGVIHAARVTGAGDSVRLRGTFTSVRIPVIVIAHSGHRDHRFRASRSLIGAKRRRRLVSCASCRGVGVILRTCSSSVNRVGPVGRCGRRVLCAVQASGGNRALGDFHARRTVHGLFVDRRRPRMPQERRSSIGSTRGIPGRAGIAVMTSWSRVASRGRAWSALSASADAPDGSAGRRSHRRRWARQSRRATRSAAAGWR